MKVETLLARALSGLGKETTYASPGKMPDFAASTWPRHASNDCSGFVDWCLRFSPNRKVDHPLYRRVNGGWFDTSAIYADGLATVGYFSKLDSAPPGAMLVYPDYTGSDGRRHDGHIGIVVESRGPGIGGVSSIVHCSLGAWRSHGDAVSATGPDIWARREDSIIVWFDDLEP